MTATLTASRPASRLRAEASYKARHPERVKEAARAYYHSEKGRDAYLRRYYGITLAEYNAMVEAQGGVCRICKKPPTMTRYGQPPRLEADHDHATGDVRGLLCSHCNTALGHFFDDPVLLGAAIEYLTEGEQDV